MNKIEFAGFTWPKQEWALPVGKPTQRVGKRRYTSGYYENAPRRAEDGKDIGFYHGEGEEPSGRGWTLRMKVLKEGWYADSSYCESWHGFTMSLPHGRGWLAGATMGDGMCAHVSRYIHETEREAAREANHMAERAAEESREADVKDQAEQEIERIREEIADNRDGILEALGERKGATEKTRNLLHIFVIERLAEIRKARKRIAALEANYREAVHA